MIGGIDIHLPTRAADASMEVAVRAVRQCWSHAVFENGVTGERYDEFWRIPFGELEELFVYRDCRFADAWDEVGATPELSNTMIHIIPDRESLTLVVDERDEPMNEIIAAIESALRDEILFVSAETETVCP